MLSAEHDQPTETGFSSAQVYAELATQPQSEASVATPDQVYADKLQTALTGRPLSEKVAGITEVFRKLDAKRRATAGLSDPTAAVDTELEGAKLEYRRILESNPNITAGLYFRKLYQTIGKTVSPTELPTKSADSLRNGVAMNTDAELGVLQEAMLATPDGAQTAEAAFRAAVQEIRRAALPTDKFKDEFDPHLQAALEAHDTRDAIAAPEQPTESTASSQPLESEQNTENPRHLTPEMQSFREALEGMSGELNDLAEQLRGPILEGKYDSVIGDDISGRFPALFIHRLMQRCAQERGTKEPSLIFVAPKKISDEAMDWESMTDLTQQQKANFQEYFNKQQSLGRLGQRTLITTEFIATGDNLSDIVTNLPDGVHPDIASAVVSPAFDMDWLGTAGGEPVHLYYSEVAKQPPLYGQRKATGRVKDLLSPTTQRSEDYDPELVRFAQEEVRTFANKAYDSLFHSEAS